MINNANSVTVNGKKINVCEKKLHVDNESIRIAPKARKLLSHLLQNPEKIFSREELLSQVWGLNTEINDRVIDANVRLLRSTLKKFALPHLIQTIHGVGYRLAIGE